VSAELLVVCHMRWERADDECLPVKKVDCVAAVRERMEVLTAQEKLRTMSDNVKMEFKDVFAPIPHVDTLPTDVYCCIRLKDSSKTIATHSYSTPQKYREAWATLIQEHLDAGRICLSNSAHVSPVFLIPKQDEKALLCWVNDYRALNANTVMKFTSAASRR
jgi:hypothetical protein